MITHIISCTCGVSQTFYGYNHSDIATSIILTGWYRLESSYMCPTCRTKHVSATLGKYAARRSIRIYDKHKEAGTAA